jgi:dUTP pyrophosphatase
MFNVQLIRKTSRLPFAQRESAGYDLFADAAGHLAPGETQLIPCGFSIDLSQSVLVGDYRGDPEMPYSSSIPVQYCALILPRSGLGCKFGVRPGNSPGLIDPDYRGEVCVCLRNDSEEFFEYTIGDRIAEMLIIPYHREAFNVVDALSPTTRGENGFGSTGV